MNIFCTLRYYAKSIVVNLLMGEKKFRPEFEPSISLAEAVKALFDWTIPKESGQLIHPIQPSN